MSSSRAGRQPSDVTAGEINQATKFFEYRRQSQEACIKGLSLPASVSTYVPNAESRLTKISATTSGGAPLPSFKK